MEQAALEEEEEQNGGKPAAKALSGGKPGKSKLKRDAVAVAEDELKIAVTEAAELKSTFISDADAAKLLVILCCICILPGYCHEPVYFTSDAFFCCHGSAVTGPRSSGKGL